MFPLELADQLDELHRRLQRLGGRERRAAGGWRRRGRVPGLDDRLQEAWDPLLAIADLAQAGWPERARTAAAALARGAEDTGEAAHGHVLIAALRTVFAGDPALMSKTICQALNGDDELPFGAYYEWRRDRAARPRPAAQAVRDQVAVGAGGHRDRPGLPPRAVRGGVAALRAGRARTRPARRRPGRVTSVTANAHPNAHGAGDVTNVTLVTLFDEVPRDARVSANGAGPERAEPSCPYPEHRRSDWALPAGEMWICGVCHPPSSAAGVVYRSAAAWTR